MARQLHLISISSTLDTQATLSTKKQAMQRKLLLATIVLVLLFATAMARSAYDSYGDDRGNLWRRILDALDNENRMEELQTFIHQIVIFRFTTLFLDPYMAQDT